MDFSRDSGRDRVPCEPRSPENVRLAQTPWGRKAALVHVRLYSVSLQVHTKWAFGKGYVDLRGIGAGSPEQMMGPEVPLALSSEPTFTGSTGGIVPHHSVKSIFKCTG